MRHLATTVIALSLLSPPVPAQERVGIAVCDEFLDKYEACVDKMPAASQQAVRDKIAQMRTAWKAKAGDPKGRSTLETGCKASTDAMKEATAHYGCSF